MQIKATIRKSCRRLVGEPVEPRRLAWDMYQKTEPDDPEDLDMECPECGQRSVTLLWETWENPDTDDWVNVDHFWCGNGHMWVCTASSYE